MHVVLFQFVLAPVQFLLPIECLVTKQRTCSCFHTKIHGKTVLNEEIPVNKYHKNIYVSMFSEFKVSV